MRQCKTALKLHHEWSTAVQNASMQSWQRIMFGERKYDRHVAKCKTCKAQRMIKAPVQKET